MRQSICYNNALYADIGCKAYLLNTSSHQPPFFIPNPLHHQPSALSRPWCFHLRTHPLIGLDFPRPMKVYGMIQAYHHANWAFGCFEGILGAFYRF